MMSLLPAPYRIAGIILLAIACVAYGWLKGAQHGEARLEAFRQSVAIEGAKAQALADAQTLRDKQRKEASDASYKTALVTLGADIDRMRKSAGPVGNILPASATAPGSSANACFDAADLERELRATLEEFRGKARAIVQKGDEARLKLDTAIKWSENRGRN